MKNIKAFLYSILCNSITGNLISLIYKKSIPDLRWKKYFFTLDRKIVSKKIIASIFFGFYESAEIKFIEKYLDDNLDVMEFGASLGIVSSHIANKLSGGGKLIIVEANPALINIIRQNITRNRCNDFEYHILNNAISYGNEHVFLNEAQDNTDTTISKIQINTSGISIAPKTLNSILKEFEINEYTIVCDIEGSEIEWLINEDVSIINCKQLIIELHEVDYGIHYTVDDIRDLIIKKHGFKLVNNIGPVYYFKK